MKLLNEDEFNTYIRSNYKKVFEADKWEEFKDEFDGFCDGCQKDVFLKIHSRSYQHSGLSRSDLPSFITYFIQCPRCGRRRFSQYVLIDVSEGIIDDDVNEPEYKSHYELYLLYSLPIKDESFANKDIPDDYKTLKESLSEAMFTMTHGKYIASTIMFRRALQIIAKEILGAKGRNLFDQLEWLKVNQNKLGVDLTNLFHENSKLIKDVGNQGAHLDEDIALHNFNEEDVKSLHDLFLVIINEIFIKPAQVKANQDELIKNRKLKT
jgi:hypothetical protein